MYGNRLVELRNEPTNFIRQREIAELIGIKLSDYGQYEREDVVIPLKYLNVICNYFEVSFDYIFGFTNLRQYKNFNNNINNDMVGVRLKSFRKSNNLSQEKLAIAIDTKKPVICNYEKGKHLIATKFLYRICKKYNISADYLLGKIDYIPDWCDNYLK